MKYLSDYTQKGVSAAISENGAFFAFGQKQFDEQKTEGIIYCSMGMGMYCPKENAQRLADALNINHERGIRADVEENGAAAIIEREYFNYEMQIAWDDLNFKEQMSSYKEFFPELFTDELIAQVSAKCYQKAIDNDWF